MLEDAMAENLVSVSSVVIRRCDGRQNCLEGVAHFMRQNGVLPEEVVVQPVATATTPSTRKYPSPQYLD